MPTDKVAGHDGKKTFTGMVSVTTSIVGSDMLMIAR